MRRLVLAVALVALLAGCGGGRSSTEAEAMETVVREWSRLLNGGDNVAVARLFALPALIVQGEFVAEFSSYEALAEWHAQLPCSGAVVTVEVVETDVVEAVFELGHRPTSRCDAAPGTLAAARFVFRDGMIVVWEQVPVPGPITTSPGGDAV